MLYLHMPHDKYLSVKMLIQAGKIKTLPDLLGAVDKTPFARDVRTTPERFSRVLRNPSLWRLADIYNIARLIDVDDKVIFDIIYPEILRKKEPGTKRKKKKGNA